MAAGDGGVDDEIAALRAAAAKAREEAAKLAKDMGKDIDVDFSSSPSRSTSAAVATAPPKKLSTAELLSSLSPINFSTADAASQSASLDDLQKSGTLSLWKKAITTNSIRFYPVSLDFLESRSDGKITGQTLGVGGEMDVSMDDFKYATLYVTGLASVLGVASLAFLPPNIGATFCYFFALIPILWIGVGSSAPGIIAGAVASLKGTKDDQTQQLDRVCRHEAAHFLCGYLCGLPVKNYQVSSSDAIPRVEFHEATTMKKELSREEVAILSIVALSGSVAEVLALGQARGGETDLMELNGFFRRSEEFMGAQKQQDYTRWGALVAYQLIMANRGVYENLVQAFKDKKSVEECIAIIES